MPLIPAPASSTVAYFTKPKPLENPDTRSVTTLAAQKKKQPIALRFSSILLQIPIIEQEDKHTMDHFTKLSKSITEAFTCCTFVKSYKS